MATIRQKLAGGLGRGLELAGKYTGVNLPGNTSGKLQSYGGQPSYTPQVKGPSTSKQPIASYETNFTPRGRNGYNPPPARAGGPGAGGPGAGSGSNPPLEQAPGQSSIDFDSLINPVLEQLGQSEAAANSIFSEQQGNVGAQQATSQSRLQNTLGSQNQLLDSGAEQQQQEGQSAADQARRQFSEIQQGLQAKFGGTTGTGAFAAELAGRETIGSISNITQGVTKALKDITDKKTELVELGRLAAEDIDNSAAEQITQARQQLEATLGSIRSQRGQLQKRKAELAMTAMQSYQSLTADIEARNTGFKQQLFMQQQAADQKLTDAQSRAKGIAESFKVMNMQQGRQISPVRVGNQGSVLDFTGNQVNNPGQLYNPGSSPTETGLEDESIFQ